jgi:hypothetical protein
VAERAWQAAGVGAVAVGVTALVAPERLSAAFVAAGRSGAVPWRSVRLLCATSWALVLLGVAGYSFSSGA